MLVRVNKKILEKEQGWGLGEPSVGCEVAAALSQWNQEDAGALLTVGLRPRESARKPASLPRRDSRGRKTCRPRRRSGQRSTVGMGGRRPALSHVQIPSWHDIHRNLLPGSPDPRLPLMTSAALL